MIKTITSKDNPLIKSLQKLKSKKGRSKSASFILDGYRIVKHAIEAKVPISEIIVESSFLDHHQLDFDGEIISVPMNIFKLLVETETPQGILAVVEMTEKNITEGPVLFLDHVQDPGNLGTLIRTADAAGFKGVMLSTGCTDPYSQKSLRSSMGSILSIPVLMNQSLEDLEELGYKMYGAALEGGVSYKALDYEKNMVLIIGNEGNGISDKILDAVNQRVFIPMHGHVESLNASIAGGILMFEIAACTS